MEIDGPDRIGDDHFTDSAPQYDRFSADAGRAVGVATGLAVGTIALMWVLRDSNTADSFVRAVTEHGTGGVVSIVLLFSAALTIGRYFGVRAAVEENYPVAIAASALVAIAYGIFGAGVLALYSDAIHAEAIALSLVLTVGCTVGAAALVFTTGRDFSDWDGYAAVAMIVGLLLFVLGTTEGAGGFLWLGFGIVLVGWLLDLVYEIYALSDSDRSPIANGIGVYVAFMGVFVHVLQLVLRMLGSPE